MNGDFGFKLEGVDELMLKLKAVSRETANKGGRAALRKAAKIVLDAAKSGAQRLDDPKTAEVIAKNLVIRWNGKAFKRTGELGLRIGVLGGARSTGKSALRSASRRRRQGVPSLESLGEISGKGKGNPGGDTFYWRFLEFGTEKIPARPFMRPALSNNVMKASDAFIAEYDKRLTRAIKRGA